MPQAKTQVQIGTQTDGILQIPGALERAEAQRRCDRRNGEIGNGPLQKRDEAAEHGSSILRASHAIVDSKPLKPDAGADLMSAMNDLESVVVGDQVSGVMDAGIVVGSRRSDR